MVKTLPLPSLSWEDPLEREMATIQYSCLGNPMDRSLAGYSLWCCKQLNMTEQLTHTHTHTHKRGVSSTKGTGV